MRHRSVASNKPPIKPLPSSPICECVHSDALTCLAQQHQMSRFNAMITYGEPNVPGYCTCACHRKERTA